MSKLPRWCHDDVASEKLPELPVYGNWRPTGFDTRGAWFNFAPDDYEKLLVGDVVFPALASDVARCNWKVLTALIQQLDPEEEEWRIECFGHWASPFDILLVKAGTRSEEVCRRAVLHIRDYYPILDEDQLDLNDSDDGDGDE